MLGEAQEINQRGNDDHAPAYAENAGSDTGAESYQDEQDGGVAYGDICKIKCNSNHGDT